MSCSFELLARPSTDHETLQSRLRTVLSYLSPFSKPKQPQPEPESESEDELDEQEHDEQPEAQFALHGQSLAHVGDATMNEHEVSLSYTARTARI